MLPHLERLRRTHQGAVLAASLRAQEENSAHDVAAPGRVVASVIPLTAIGR